MLKKWATFCSLVIAAASASFLVITPVQAEDFSPQAEESSGILPDFFYDQDFLPDGPLSDIDTTPGDTANPFNSQLGATGSATGQPYGYIHPIVFVLRWVMVGFTFLGIGTIAGIVYAGFMWMTSAGDSDRVEKAKRTLRNGIIGLVIIISSYSIVWFIGRTIQRETASFGTRGPAFESNLFAD